jgi:RNA polymerase sigma factor (TIGR02999 family)
VGTVDEDPSRAIGELYAELRLMADRLMRSQHFDSVLQSTALANEAFLKLHGHECLADVGDRARVLAVASAAMRNLLVDRARSRNRLKRCPSGKRVAFDEVTLAYVERAVDLVALHEALDKLAAFDPLMSRAVDLRFFGGLSMQEAADCLDVPLRTLERRWEVTRRWLSRKIK